MDNARVEVREKIGVYDAVAEGLKRDILDLGIREINGVEYIRAYTVRGKFSKNGLKRLAEDILTDRISQECSYSAPLKQRIKGSRVVEVAYNRGVMDPVEESVLKAACDAGISGIRSVSTSKKYAFSGPLSDMQIRRIAEGLLYNKMIQHILPENGITEDAVAYRFQRVEIGLLKASDAELSDISKKGQLYLSLAEMRTIRDYFKRIGRNPTDCELETLAQTWSEHCKHKTMMGEINYNGQRIGNLLKDTVMKVTRELDKPWCVSVFKDNAGIIKFDSKNDICFKVETHNHPSALEPYGGAETGLGGVIRDCMGTGRGAKPIANTDVFCFGIPDASKASIPKGTLHPKRVLKGVVSGVRDYGNKMGIPTVNGAVCFDERYTGNPLVYCGNVGIMPHKFSSKKVSPGDLIVTVGGGTGRDGIHGATFSSSELTHESETISSSAVQIGNPITEKKVMDTLIKARDLGLYESVTDCGAGGFSSAVGEMGETTGADVWLDRVPLKYEGLKPWEIWVSEAQERMVLAVRPEKLKSILRIFSSEDVSATVIGEFTGTGRLRLFYSGEQTADIDMDFLHNGLPKLSRKAVWKRAKEKIYPMPALKKDHTTDLFKILSSWNICSKEWIIRQYDHEVQGGSVLKPLVGKNNDGPSDAAIIRPFINGRKGIALSNGINPRYGDIDPYWMAASAIDEAVRQLVSVGVDPQKIALLDNFCWGNTDNAEQLGSLVRASRACYDVAKIFGTPFISGKDSLNNEFNDGKKKTSIPPTLLISAIGVVDNVARTVSSDVKLPGASLYVIGRTFWELGGSQYFLLKNKCSGAVPKLDPDLSIRAMNRLFKAIKKGLVVSAHDCSEGGLAVALSEMLFAGGYGGDFTLKYLPIDKNIKRDDIVLFSESNSRFIVEVPPRFCGMFESLMKGIPYGLLGTVKDIEDVTVKGLRNDIVVRAGISQLKNAWKSPFDVLMSEK